ncbi:MAG: protease complex subunit PrcB family protein [Lachnospiraceae bacterium]
MKKLSYIFILLLFVSSAFICGCEKEKDEPKVKDVEFTLVPEEDLPDALATIIEDKKTGDMMLTYATENELYIVRGYGCRPTGGYDIQVKDCYLTENNIKFVTTLTGPDENENTTSVPSYPYIVIKTEYMEQPIKFITE